MDAGDLMFAGIARQAALVRAGEVSARELTEASLARISALDPRLNAFRVVLGEEALAAADAADARRRSGDEAPLLGVPLAVKDDCAVTGHRATFGTDAVTTPARADAEVVRRLRTAGAVVVGITNVPELTILPVTESPANGATRNPWDPSRTPGGSSGGTGAAVAAGMVGAGLAADGAGSIRIPAGCCALVGLKPSRGRVPTAPVAEPWHGLATWGPLARRAEDTALFLDAVGDGGDSLAAAARRAPARLKVAVSFAVPPPVRAQVDDEQRGAVMRLVEALRGAGHTVMEGGIPYRPGMSLAVTARYLRGIHDAAGVLDRPDRLARRTRGYVRLGGLIPRRGVARARAAEASHRDELLRAFKGGVDLVVTPMFTRRPPRIGEWEGQGALRTFDGTSRFVPFCALWNHTGQPAMALPAGFAADGFPLSAQLVARPGQDGLLLGVAAQLQDAIAWPEARPPIS